MSLIDIKNLTFAYEGSFENVFENVSFQMDTNWKLGFTGRNGRGKTTFLNLLLKKYEYSGSISAAVPFEYFPYAVANEEDFTIDVIQTKCPGAEDWEVLREFSLLSAAEEALYRPFNTLSNGEQTKALLAAMFLKDNSFLLIDEPTNHLDAEARKAVGRYLNRKKGFLLVSHDRALLDSCVDHILSINRANIEIQAGNFSAWLCNKERQDQFERAENEKLKKDIARLASAAKRTSQWSEQVEKTKYGTKNSGLRPDRGFIGHKAAKTMARSKNIENRRQTAIDEKAKLLLNIESSEKLKITPLPPPPGRLLSLKDVAISYGGRPVCQNIDFTVVPGDRIALTGKNGSGKSSLLKCIAGEAVEYSGTLFKNSQLKISYVPQNTAGLSGSLSDYAQFYGIEESLFKAILRKLDFSRAQFEKKMEDYSAGQRKKVLLARSLCEKAHLYLWDEPLNYIDIFSRMQIETLLTDYQPTILFVEHDAAFCENVATQFLHLGN